MEIEIFTREDDVLCAEAKKIVQKVASEFGDKVTVKEVDVDTERGDEEEDNLGVLSTPTVIIAKDMRITGVPKEKVLRQAIQKELDLIENE